MNPESVQPEAIDSDIPSTWAFWTGWVLTILASGGLAFSAATKFMKPTDPQALKEMTDMVTKIGWSFEQLPGLGILELSCVVIYLIPRTSVLGAILLTGYLGGALATHVRVGDFGIAPHIILGLLVWLGLFLRNPRLQTLIPINRY